MSNPFLFDDEGDAPTEAVNPFLLEGDSRTEETNDNPFDMAQASNPFAFDGGDDEPEPNVQEQKTVPVQQPASTGDTEDKAMSFFGTTITEDDDHDIVDVQPTTVIPNDGKAPPPPRPMPPNQHTQDLISSVADHLDQTSSHMLDRIPKTRTPSPVSMRDLHSPSPTPDMANLLLSDHLEPDNSEAVLRSDNPFADYDEPIVNQIEAKPQRPVPPRPVAAISQIVPEQAAQQHPVEADLFDFGLEETAPKPQAPKTNQDIMNLFAAPTAPEPAKLDLLMDEPIQTNLPAVVAPSNNIRPPLRQPPQRPTPPAIPSVAPVVSVPSVAPIVENKPAPEEKPSAIPKAPSVEDIPHVEKQATPVTEEPTETVPISTITINDEPFNSTVQENNGFGDIEKSDTISDNSSAVGSSYQQTPPGVATPGVATPGVATPFYTAGPDAQYLDRSQTPVSKEEFINSYINDTVSPATSNPFGSPEAITPVPARPPPPTRPRPPKLEQNDNFDAFAAKFDSVKKGDNNLFDGFGSGSGYKSPAAADGKF